MVKIKKKETTTKPDEKSALEPKVLSDSKNDIEEIFSNSKKRKVDSKKEVKSSEEGKEETEEEIYEKIRQAKAKIGKISTKIPENDSFFDSRGKLKAKRYTDDGLPIFTVEEMNIGLGGDTPDCPFDCKCCY